MMHKKSQAALGVCSFIFSFLASSHHWLHMGIMLLLGGSTEMLSAMSAVLWVRRVMVLATLATAFFSIFRLYKHRCKEPWVVAITVLSTALSLGFIFYTLNRFGW